MLGRKWVRGCWRETPRRVGKRAGTHSEKSKWICVILRKKLWGSRFPARFRS